MVGTLPASANSQILADIDIMKENFFSIVWFWLQVTVFHFRLFIWLVGAALGEDKLKVLLRETRA